MKTLQYFITAFLLFSAYVLFAQPRPGEPCKECTCILQKARKATAGKEKSYESAIKLYNSARNNCPPDSLSAIDASVVALFKEINGLLIATKIARAQAEVALYTADTARIAAINSESRAREALAEAESAKIAALKSDSETKVALNEAVKAREKAIESDSLTKEALAKAKNLIDAFYFYDDKYALAYGVKDNKKVFYFIDKLGKEVERLGRWEMAEQFDWRGVAKVKKKRNSINNYASPIDYLLDPSGKTYRVAYRLENINNETTALDLSNQILVIPDTIYEHNQLEVVLINNCQLIGSSPHSQSVLDYMSNLISDNYSVSGNYLSPIRKLKKLTKLSLVQDNLSSLPYEIGELKNLEELDLTRNKLSSLPAQIGELKSVRQLRLGHNLLDSLPTQIGGLKGLTKLYLQYNNLTYLPDQIGELKELAILSVISNKLSSLPPQIGKLGSLTTLNLSRNYLDSLPAQIGELKNLTVLEMSDNLLSNLPEQIGGLDSLTTLILSRNKLTCLPAQIGELKNLTVLEMSDNLLSSLPEQIGGLNGLTTLRLSRNKLINLPAQIGELPNLMILDLTQNEDLSMTDICRAFADYPKDIAISARFIAFDKSADEFVEKDNILKTLFIGISKQTHLPREIGELKNLIILNFPRSTLTSLPEQIGKLDRLTTLILSHNSLTYLPAQVGELKNLTTLELDANQLTSLPPQIGNLKKLTTLNLRGNPISQDEQEKIRRLLPKSCNIFFSPPVKFKEELEISDTATVSPILSPQLTSSPSILVIAGSFNTLPAAESHKTKLLQLGYTESMVVPAKSGWYNVLVNRYTTRAEVEAVMRELKETHGIAAWVEEN